MDQKVAKQALDLRSLLGVDEVKRQHSRRKKYVYGNLNIIQLVGVQMGVDVGGMRMVEQTATRMHNARIHDVEIIHERVPKT